VELKKPKKQYVAGEIDIEKKIEESTGKKLLILNKL